MNFAQKVKIANSVLSVSVALIVLIVKNVRIVKIVKCVKDVEGASFAKHVPNAKIVLDAHHVLAVQIPDIANLK